MLKTRIITALILLAVLLPVLFFGHDLLIQAVLTLIFALTCWESFRMFGNDKPVLVALLLAPALPLIIRVADFSRLPVFLAICVAVWCVRFMPALKLGLPPLKSMQNRMLNGMYAMLILASFLGMYILHRHSPQFLLSVFFIVIIADSGAYACGRMFGKRKLAPSISPSKTWEGAVGGWLCVLIIGAVSAQIPALSDTFAYQLLAGKGWLALMAVLTMLVALSIGGDLFESCLKRRAEMKDSSNLLPGHGGVLDRMDAMIPVLPLASLLEMWL